MSRGVVRTLIYRLGKIYFSKNKNKDYLYKKEIFNTLKDMGGVYNKFLQVLCVTKNFMKGWSTPKDFEVFNKSPIEEIDWMDGIPFLEQYESIDYMPIAAGSFAQIYKGKLKSGEIVALKVLRPSVYHNLESDLRNLERLVKIFSFFIPSDAIDIKEMFFEFKNTCMRETDYEQEISNMKYFAQMYEKNNYIKIPKVYEELSTKYLIVQEYIPGVTLADVITDLNSDERLEEKVFELTGSNLWKQLIIVGGELIRSAVEEDFLYGDPHAGNIILLPNDKVAFVDFGIVANPPISKRLFYKWVKSYNEVLNKETSIKDFLEITITCFCPDYVSALKKWGDYNFLEKVLGEMEHRVYSITDNLDVLELIKNGHIFILFTEFMDKKNLIGLNIDMRNYGLLKAMQAFICTIFTIDGRFQGNNFVFLLKGAMEYALKVIKNIPTDVILNSSYSMEEAFLLLDKVLTRMANNDEMLFNVIYKEMSL